MDTWKVLLLCSRCSFDYRMEKCPMNFPWLCNMLINTNNWFYILKLLSMSDNIIWTWRLYLKVTYMYFFLPLEIRLKRIILLNNTYKFTKLYLQIHNLVASLYIFIDKGMEECKKLGLAKSIGVSNFNIRQLKTILENCTIKPASNQVKWISFGKLVEISVLLWTYL